MAINTEDLKTIYKMFNDETFAKLQEFQLVTEMEDEHLATVIGESVKSAMSSSVSALSIFKQRELIDKEIITEGKKADDLTSAIAVREVQSGKDALVKDAQKQMIDKQILTEAERPALIIRQKNAYDDKNRVEKAKALLNTQGMIGASGNVPDTALVTAGMTAANAI